MRAGGSFLEEVLALVIWCPDLAETYITNSDGLQPKSDGLHPSIVQTSVILVYTTLANVAKVLETKESPMILETPSSWKERAVRKPRVSYVLLLIFVSPAQPVTIFNGFCCELALRTCWGPGSPTLLR